MVGEGTLLVVIFGSLHLLGVAFGALLLVPLLRDEQPPLWVPSQEDDDDHGGSDRLPSRSPRDPSPGGLPLPDALPTRIRLRQPARLGDLTPKRDRRPAHRPRPVPQREREPV